MENKELYEALQKFQQETVFVKATTKNDFLKSKYAQYKDVVLASRDNLKKNDLMVIQRIMHHEGRVAVYTELLHVKTGQSMDSVHILAYQGEDSQKQGGAITYAKRYSYVTILGLLVDADDDGHLASKKDTSKIEDAKLKLGKSKSLEELKKNYFSLGPLMADEGLRKFKDELKSLLEETA